jgi:hypothetical protein
MSVRSEIESILHYSVTVGREKVAAALPRLTEAAAAPAPSVDDRTGSTLASHQRGGDPPVACALGHQRGHLAFAAGRRAGVGSGPGDGHGGLRGAQRVRDRPRGPVVFTAFGEGGLVRLLAQGRRDRPLAVFVARSGLSVQPLDC